MTKELCKLCDKEYVNLGSHIRAKHNITIEEYNLMVSEDTELTNELEDNEVVIAKEEEEAKQDDKILPIEIKENIFDGVVKPSEDELLKDFLVKYQVTREELIKLIKGYKGEAPVPALQMVKAQVERGDKTADEIASDGKETLEIRDLYVAESLVKKHGYVCERIDKDANSKNKRWILKKT